MNAYGGNVVVEVIDPSAQKASATNASSKITMSCKGAQQNLKDLRLDRRKVSAVSNARGLLDQGAPEPIAQTLSLLAEIAIERARSGALALMKEKFVQPLCSELTLGLLKIGTFNERAMPRTCALTEQLRLEDVMGSGRALLQAIEDDVRSTLVPALLAHLPNLNEQTRTLAKLALNFISRINSGHVDGVVEIDYLVAVLDVLPWGSGLDRSSTVINAWIQYLIEKKLVDADSVKRALVEASLPADFYNPLTAASLGARELAGCKPAASGTTFKVLDRKVCVDAIVTSLQEREWLSAAVQRKVISLEKAIVTISNVATTTFEDWVQKEYIVSGNATNIQQILESDTRARRVVDASCGVRLVVGIVKWCSTRSSCTANDVSSLLQQPSTVFRPDSEFPGKLCWKEQRYRVPGKIEPFIDLGARMVAFLDRPAKGTERTRILAMVHWMFDAVRVLAPPDDQLNLGNVARIEEIVTHLANKDFMSALTNSIDIAQTLVCPPSNTGGSIACDTSASARKSMQFLGAVASYARTYDETQKLDAASAKEARKKALERLIDSATDRRERGRDWVVSLGSNVGIGIAGTKNVGSKLSMTGASLDDDIGAEVAVRVPLGITAQWLPGQWDSREDAGWLKTGWLGRHLGVHLGLQIIDLGQFVRNDETNRSITWSTFVAPGVEFGVLVGQPHRAISITAYGTYVPTIVENSPPVVRFGVTLSYYVPFFDFN